MRVWGWTEPVIAVVLAFLASIGAIYKVAYYDSLVAGGVVWPTDGFALAALLVSVALLLREFVMRDRPPAIPSWLAVVLGALLLAALIFAYAVYSPRWTGTADSANALDVGLGELLSGRNPYLAETFLGNRVSPMMGGFVLAWPFYVLFDTAGVQTIAWLIIAAVFLFRVAGPRATVAFLALSLASPIIRLNLVTQFDHLAIAMALVVAGSLGYFAVRAEPRRAVSVALYGSAIVFGAALADRFIYLVTLIPLAAVMWKTGEKSRAGRWTVAAGTSAVILMVLPIFLDRDVYISGPLSLGLQKAGGGDSPLSTVLLLVAGVAVLGLVTWRVKSLAEAWLGSAIVLGVLMLVNVILIGLDVGWFSALTGYVAVDYNGAWLLMSLVGLVLPRDFLFGRGILPRPVNEVLDRDSARPEGLRPRPLPAHHHRLRPRNGPPYGRRLRHQRRTVRLEPRRQRAPRRRRLGGPRHRPPDQQSRR